VANIAHQLRNDRHGQPNPDRAQHNGGQNNGKRTIHIVIFY
jgi:hypothetical protein